MRPVYVKLHHRCAHIYLKTPEDQYLSPLEIDRQHFDLTNRIERVIDVPPPLEEKDAKTLLLRRLPDDKSSEEDTIALLGALEHLPLAITQAAAYIGLRNTRMTIGKYLAYAQENEEVLLAGTCEETLVCQLRSS